MTSTITFPISSTAFSTIEGSELYYDATRYDGGSLGAVDATAALRGATFRKAGKGASYVVTTTHAGAAVIADYCSTVGETWVGETEPETRADGRALLTVAARIARVVAADPAPEPPQMTTTPTADDQAAEALAGTPTPQLLRAAYALTHRIDYECRQHSSEDTANELRAQRDLIDAEVLRRTGDR